MSGKRATLRLAKLAPWLRGAGALLLAAGLTHLYADRVIFDVVGVAAELNGLR